MIIFRDLRKAFDTEGRTILLSKLSLSFRIESKYSLLVVYSLKPVPSNVVSAEAEYIKSSIDLCHAVTILSREIK